MRSAIVLVGGEARRANGREKYFFRLEGKTFIERLVCSLLPVVDEIVLVARNAEQCGRFSDLKGVRCVADIKKGLGPIGGIHAGVLASRGDLLFVCACDMPCVSTRVVEELFDALGDYDAVIPSWDSEMLEPLHAVYRKEPLLHYLGDHGSLSLRDMVRSLNSRLFPVDRLRPADPDLITFTNINKLEDLAAVSPEDPAGKTD
ncbi:MAG: molybdenum cofactor guanylyltransferase [Methanomicrobiales archaeon]|nr:molybdenum cofactor guanylyltransferase [Methanomicrobiales archaeon]NYT20729.1 molybdenum cofactor guanylyltransferase [Methanomicrobiales archaeon]